MIQDQTLHCLWSGGWDSSFMVLQAVVVEKRPVQPYYLYDHRRKSTQWEIHAIKNIYRGLKRDFPQEAGLLKPMVIYNKSRLKQYPDLKKVYRGLADSFRLGIQYEWFARFARQYGIHALEVGFILHTEDTSGVFTILLSRMTEGEGHERKVKENPRYPFIRAFADIRFPIMHLDKKDMARMASEKGFHHLLVLSWYCFNPGPNGETCGQCYPCEIARKSGNTYSLSPETHIPRENYPFNRWFRSKILEIS